MEALENIQYGFDRDNRRTWRQRATTQGWDNAYAYDSLSQVVNSNQGDLNLARNAIAGVPSNGSQWKYDQTGNWHGYQKLVDGASSLVQSRTHDKGNRLMEVTDASAMRTDRAGRMLEITPGPGGDWSKGYRLTWDAWSRVTAVASVEGDSVIPLANYGYDGLSRRITHRAEAEDVTQHSYYSDNWRPLEERGDDETTATVSYIWGARHRDDLIRRDRAVEETTLNETRYVLMDYFSPAAITDSSGNVTERYEFSAFGLRTILKPDFTVRSGSECDWEFSFQGQFEDRESGWLNYGFRYYIPALGRWGCKDPIVEGGGLNLYEYTNNNPINQVDKYGLKGSGCAITLYQSHYTSHFNWRRFRWEPGIKASAFRSRQDGRVAGFLGCGANKLNQLQLQLGIGIPSMPQNNCASVRPEHLAHARQEGFDPTDFQIQGDEADDLDEALEAARDKAAEMCKEKKCECQSIEIEIKCGSQQVKNERYNRGGGNNKCNTTESVPC